MKYLAKSKRFIAGVVTSVVLVITTFSSNSHADFYGLVNVLNTPLNTRACGSSSCQRLGRFLRDELAVFEGNYSSSRWLRVANEGAFTKNDGHYAYGRYIRRGSNGLNSSLGISTRYSATTTSALNLRTGPMVQYDRITTIPQGALITVTEINGRYRKVLWAPFAMSRVREGYVHSNWVRRR